jgi:type III secretion protein J
MRVRTIRFVALFFILFNLSGCKEVLYSDLAEREANEMVALLASSNIHASRERDKDGIYSVSVETVDIPAAVTILKAANLPGEKFMSFGDVFSSEGIVSTPFEQHALYLHALNQELSHTLSELSSIRKARVLITSQPKGRYDREPTPATASVSIEYEPGADMSSRIGTIKSLVSHAVPNLDYDNVAVAMFQTEEPVAVQNSTTFDPKGRSGLKMAGFGFDGWRALLFVLGFISLAGALTLLFRRPPTKPSRKRRS